MPMNPNCKILVFRNLCYSAVFCLLRLSAVCHVNGYLVSINVRMSHEIFAFVSGQLYNFSVGQNSLYFSCNFNFLFSSPSKCNIYSTTIAYKGISANNILQTIMTMQWNFLQKLHSIIGLFPT